MTHLLSGWWLTCSSEKYEFVSWDDGIPNIWKTKNWTIWLVVLTILKNMKVNGKNYPIYYGK
jgi:hypothetical protein